MQIFHGSTAASDFRLKKLLSTLQLIDNHVQQLSASFIHFAHISEDLSTEEEKHLSELLDYGSSRDDLDKNGQLQLVIPRPGTISPWSSKATDIAHNCSLTKVLRLERGIAWSLITKDSKPIKTESLQSISQYLHDRMTETVLTSLEEASILFDETRPKPLQTVVLGDNGQTALEKANLELGLALSDVEIQYLLKSYEELGRDPTDVELMMFAQANSEHCRHKIFNSTWTIDGEKQDETLFSMIRKTFQTNPGHVLSAYEDNAAVAGGYSAERFFPDVEQHRYGYHEEDVNLLMKVETHNHPTAISPFPGAATGSGGEIRDETATGRGAKPKAGLTGFSVSNLNIPDFIHPWENDYGKPDRIVSALDIMIEGPIGGAAFNNEFGRPNLCGYFRSYEQLENETGRIRGYHKPIMIAGGYGMIRSEHVEKDRIPAGAKLIVLGGPAMLIGLGGGAASSMASGSSHEDLDFASVQRQNPEIQRRCQEVVDRCWAMGKSNPIISIHDVGAGGLSNALPELVSDSDRGAVFELRKIPNDEPGMSPMEIWCNESQERYVLAISAEHLEQFTRLCQRERAPFAILGEATAEQQLVLNDILFDNKAIDIPMSVLLGKLPRMLRSTQHGKNQFSDFDIQNINLKEAIKRLLRLPTIADKRFLITIGDRSVSGLVCRDQMVGPWQVPVADCAVSSSAYGHTVGEAMAMGERSPIALIDAPASGRMALAEAITNIAAARILQISDIALSANWMAACGQLDEDAKLFDTVSTISELCQSLGICIPVGKDSLSMNTIWQEQDVEQQSIERQVSSPLSLVITAFAPVADTRLSLTPQLRTLEQETLVVLIDLGRGKNRMGGSCLTQVYNHIGSATPDLDQPEDLKNFFRSIQLLNEMGLLLAYHDRSDGGLLTTLIEMCLAGRMGVSVSLDALPGEPAPVLFNEELGAVIQIRKDSLDAVNKVFATCGELQQYVFVLGQTNTDKQFRIEKQGSTLFSESLEALQEDWSLSSYHMQSLRDNPDCAKQEYQQVCNMEDGGLFVTTTFDEKQLVPPIKTHRPRIAVLREQGVNGQTEMAAAFDRAGFDAIDVHMTDLINRHVNLDSFSGLAACGGFSYGDVLGAGGGWAKSILFNSAIRDQFQHFFQREDTFAFGVCNGCQMLSQLRDLIPGAEHWPDFVRNHSEQFEARLVMVEIMDSPSILLNNMTGSMLPIVVAHGEGRVAYKNETDFQQVISSLRYVDNHGNATEAYPCNPNGSVSGETGFTTADGRFTIMMPHPERVFLRSQFSWLPESWKSENGPWMTLFNNARKWLG